MPDIYATEGDIAETVDTRGTIERYLELLNSVTGELDGRIITLEHRLDPCLRPDEPHVKEDHGTDKAMVSSVANSLATALGNLRNMIDRVDGITRRVDL